MLRPLFLLLALVALLAVQTAASSRDRDEHGDEIDEIEMDSDSEHRGHDKHGKVSGQWVHFQLPVNSTDFEDVCRFRVDELVIDGKRAAIPASQVNVQRNVGLNQASSQWGYSQNFSSMAGVASLSGTAIEFDLAVQVDVIMLNTAANITIQSATHAIDYGSLNAGALKSNVYMTNVSSLSGTTVEVALRFRAGDDREYGDGSKRDGNGDGDGEGADDEDDRVGKDDGNNNRPGRGNGKGDRGDDDDDDDGGDGFEQEAVEDPEEGHKYFFGRATISLTPEFHILHCNGSFTALSMPSGFPRWRPRNYTQRDQLLDIKFENLPSLEDCDTLLWDPIIASNSAASLGLTLTTVLSLVALTLAFIA
eukprot:m.188922 g.188922  ORF g.188922 m.188922 type:complete len:364 (+) comp14789_c5_seq2:268-1359(+)